MQTNGDTSCFAKPCPTACPAVRHGIDGLTGVLFPSAFVSIPFAPAVSRGARLQTRAAQQEEEATDAPAAEGDQNFVKAALAQVP